MPAHTRPRAKRRRLARGTDMRETLRVAGAGQSTLALLQGANVFRQGDPADVYFDFDQATLTPAGRMLVDTVAAEMRNDPTLGAKLLGKTDMPGAEPYNMALSDRRATAVKDALIEAGIAANRIDARWVGEMEPPMMTAETAREQRNRVVEITIN